MRYQDLWHQLGFKSARQSIMASVYAMLAIYSTLMTILLLFLDQRYVPRYLILFGLMVFVCIGIFRGRPRLPEISFRSSFSVKLVVGDLFDESGSCVIGMATTFDTETASGIIGATSLQGQFLHRIYNGDTVRLDSDLGSALSKYPVQKTVTKPGKNSQYAMGTVAVLKRESGAFWYCLAYTNLDENNVASTSISDLEASLSNLWKEVDIRSNGAAISIPLIGCEQARLSNFSAERSFFMIASSFILRSHQSRVSQELRIVVQPSVLGELDLCKLQQFLITMKSL